MAMLLALLTILMLFASMYAGHRFNMYLYARGAVGRHRQHMMRESHALRQVREGSLVQVRDYGLSYARTGILIFAIVLLALVFSVVILIASVL